MGSCNGMQPAKGGDFKIRRYKLRGGVNWQGALKPKKHKTRPMRTHILFISVINQLDAQNFCFTISLFHACTSFEHHVLIIRRSKLHYTASGIITPVGGRLVHRLLMSTCAQNM